MSTPKFSMCDTRKPDGCYIEFSRVIIQDHDDNPSEYLFQDAEYHDADQARLDSFNAGEWHMLGIRARATITIVKNGHGFTFSVDSAGLWSIESDSGEEYFQEVYHDEIEKLKHYLSAIKIDPSKITTII